MMRLHSYPAVSTALLPYVISRFVVATAAVFVLVLVPAHRGGLASVFTSWDGQWYLSIAEHGYLPGSDVVRPGAPPDADTSVDGAVAFLPAYPMVVAAVGVIVPGPLDAVAVVVALVIGGAATVAFAQLCGCCGRRTKLVERCCFSASSPARSSCRSPTRRAS